MYRPTMSRTFSTKRGSSEILKPWTTCGWSPKARQIRPTVEWLIPAFSAIFRVLQWVRPFGWVSNVSTITASTFSSEILRGAPGRFSSYNASVPPSMNRRRHFDTVT